jgi:acetyl-CoA C-acetyltransferase
MKIAVIGAFQTKYGEHWDKSIYDLLAQSQLGALADAKIKAEEIDSIFTGNMCSETFCGQKHLGAIAANILNINIPSIGVESTCASGSIALREGIMSILSGQSEVVITSGVEKMTDVDAHAATTALLGAGYREQEGISGISFPGLFALISRVYMEKYKITKKQMAHVSVKNHDNAFLNPHAHLKKKITINDVISSPTVADPLSLLDCSPICDGSASLILSTPEFAKKRNLKAVFIIASALSTDSLSICNRENLTSFDATKQAGKAAYEMAKIKPTDIDVVELHDAFSTSEIISLEDLGFFKPGTAMQETIKGKTKLNSKLPVNPSGGLKAKGHPVGATGMGQAVEVVDQLRGRCEQRQVKNAETGLTHNMGGAGTTVAVHIFSK